MTDDQTIQTTIPYDEGWIVTVDGKAVETYKTYDALVAFDIEESGEHQISIKYRSKPFVYGMTLTVVSVIIFAVLIIFEKKIFGFIYTKIYEEYDQSKAPASVEQDSECLIQESSNESDENQTE